MFRHLSPNRRKAKRRRRDVLVWEYFPALGAFAVADWTGLRWPWPSLIGLVAYALFVCIEMRRRRKMLDREAGEEPG